MEDRPNSGGIGRRIRALSAVGVGVWRAGRTILPVWALPVRTHAAAMPCRVCVCPDLNTRGSYALFPVYRCLRMDNGLAGSFEATVQHCFARAPESALFRA